ncbi:hypothetical protein PPACK8108_LOCUS11486 [Phakopsora pachyrhizi]|uniref:Uncharacterized protein n=1 Tax=Phakopsora pachyrhizi TaxID=170000 RepID=A0AAV0B5A3_PHAPC|nr:hypothetical protein PPACK8108_LOCUS11486 [Phakopsora pachyrhizi]
MIYIKCLLYLKGIFSNKFSTLLAVVLKFGKSLGVGCNKVKLRYQLYSEYIKLASVESPRSIEEKHFSSQVKRSELIKLYELLQEERSQKKKSAVQKRQNQEASVTFLATASTTCATVALRSPKKNRKTTSTSSGRNHGSALSKSSAIDQTSSYSPAVAISKRRSVLPDNPSTSKWRKGHISTATPKSSRSSQRKSHPRISKKKNEDENNSIPNLAATPMSETSTQLSFFVPISKLRTESPATAPAIDHTSTNSEFCLNEDRNASIQSAAATTSETPTKSSAANQSSFYSPSQSSAVNYSNRNTQPEPRISYSAEVSLSAEWNQRSALPESPIWFKRQKGLISSKFFVTSLANVILENLTKFIFPAATPKTSGPSRRNSHPQISKKKNKDFNEPGFVYNPPSQHSYSTRLSTATPLQSSAANQSSCYSPSQSSAINHSIPNIQSEPLISYSAEVSFSAERNQICGYPSCSSSGRQMQSFYSTPITSPANSSIDRQQQNIFHKNLKTSKRLRRYQKEMNLSIWKDRDNSTQLSNQIQGNFQGSNESFVSQWQASVCPTDLESGAMSFLPSHSCSGKKIASEMLEGINCIAQGINCLQMSVNQGQSKGKMKVTGEGRNNTLLAQARQHVATLFGKDLDMKNQIFPAPATKSERRLWRNHLRNDSDDDELSQSDEDIEGQDPSFLYPGGPGSQSASSQTLSIMQKAMPQSGIKSFCPNLSKPMNNKTNQLIKAGEYSDIDLEMCLEEKLYQTLVNHVKHLGRCFNEAKNWTNSDQEERDKRRGCATRRSNRCKSHTTYVMSHNTLVPLINIVANCTSDDETVIFSDLDEEDSGKGIKTVAVLHIPWGNPIIEEMMKNIDRLANLTTQSGPSSSSRTEKVKRIRIRRSNTTFVKCPKDWNVFEKAAGNLRITPLRLKQFFHGLG